MAEYFFSITSGSLVGGRLDLVGGRLDLIGERLDAQFDLRVRKFRTQANGNKIAFYVKP